MEARRTITEEEEGDHFFAFSLITLSLGILILAYTLYAFINKLSFLNKASHAEGAVVELVKRVTVFEDKIDPINTTSYTTYAPVVEFKTKDGSQIKFTSSVGSDPPCCLIGQKVDVLFLEDNPRNAVINTFFSLWGLVVMLGFFGVSFFSMGIGIWAFVLRR